MTDWLSPLNKLRWRAAFKAKAPQLTLDDGRVFDLNYDKRKAHGEVLVTPRNRTGELVPRGYFSIEKVLGPMWFDQ